MASINFYYRMYATQFMTLNLDEKSLFISIPSESNGESYRVDMNEETMQAEKCNCLGFRYHHGHCKHCTIVNEEYAECSKSLIINAAMDIEESIEESYEMVAPVVETPVVRVRKVRKVRTPLVRKSGNKLVLVAKKSPVLKIIEMAVEAVVPTPKKDMMTASLYSNQGFQILR